MSDLYDGFGNKLGILEDVDKLKNDLAELGEIQILKVTKESNILTKNETRGYINSNGLFSENSGYYVYYFSMPENGEIWFDEQTVFCRIGIYNGNLFDTNSLEFYGNQANGTLPYEESKLSVQKGCIIAINIQTNTRHNFSLNIPNGFALTNTQKEIVKNYIGIDSTLTKSGVPADAKVVGDLITSNIKKSKCIYRKLNSPDDNHIYYTDKIAVWDETRNNITLGKILSIYIPTNVGYVNYNFGKSWSGKDSSGNEIVGGYDVWRMCIAYAVDDDLSKRFEITRGGEWEMACKISGRPDFIGGYEHGDEYGQTVRVYIDGKIIDVESITELTEFITLKVVCVSDMLDPNDHTTKVGIHCKEWLFSDGIATLTQSIQWMFVEPTVMTASYMTMFPAIRGNDENSEYQITDSYYSDVDMTVQDCSTGDGTTEKHDSLIGDVNKVTIYSEKSGFHGSVEIIDYPKLNGNEVHISGGVNRANKIYFTLCGGTGNATIEPNAIWKSKSIYRLEIVEGTEIR